MRLTLARKLDAVHRNTVTSRSVIPSVRRATPISPNFDRKLLPFDPAVPVLRSEEVADAPISVRRSECVLLLEPIAW